MKTPPFIFIGTHTIREGKLEDYKEGLQEFFDFVEANEPRLIAINFYVNDDDTELSRRPDPSRCGVDGVPHAAAP